MKGKFGKLKEEILFEKIDRDRKCKWLEDEIENLKMTLAGLEGERRATEKWYRVATIAISLLSYMIVAVVTFVILYITRR